MLIRYAGFVCVCNDRKGTERKIHLTQIQYFRRIVLKNNPTDRQCLINAGSHDNDDVLIRGNLKRFTINHKIQILEENSLMKTQRREFFFVGHDFASYPKL